VRVQRHASALGSWELVHGTPHPALRGHVLRYCGYAEDTAAPLARREVPAPEVTVIVSFGPEIDVGGERFGSFAAGFDDAYAETRHAGHQRGLELKLAPLAVRRLLGVPASELSGRVVPLDALLDRGGRELVARVQNAPDWPERFALLDAGLRDRLDRTPRVAGDVAHAWQRLAAAHGAIGIAALADELGWSRRRFGERFREHVGLAPKTAARVLRFRRVLELLAREDGPGLAAIAQASGYYDQAHLNRDFRAFTGGSPRAYLARLLPDGGGMSGEAK
jgi:AraC-like DNA-binding protein